MRLQPRLLALAGCLLLAACTSTGGNPARGRAAAATAQALTAEPLTLQLSRFPDGSVHELASDRGKVVLLDVWATWCEPCVESLPFYESLAATYRERGLEVYALSLDEDPRQVAQFLEQQGLSIQVFLDGPEQRAAQALRVNGVPTSYLIDRQGRIRYVHEGWEPELNARYVAQVEALLAEKAE